MNKHIVENRESVYWKALAVPSVVDQESLPFRVWRIFP